MNALIKKFGIYGLYGYKNVTIDFDDPTTIIVAENGMGKTTILSALNNILTGKFSELRSISFNSIEILFQDGENISIYSSEIKDDFSLNTDFRELSAYIKNGYDIYNIANQIKTMEFDEIKKLDWYRTVYMESPHSHEELRELTLKAKAYISNLDTTTFKKINTIKTKLSDIEILFLPTYRRVEKSNLREQYNQRDDFTFSSRMSSSGRIRENIKTDIAFGLADVETKLKSISEDIERISNIDYRSLSATMLEDLMTGNTKPNQNNTYQLPEINDLSRFLGRVISSRQKQKTDEIVNRISNLYQSNEIEKNTYLFYFLTKLNDVINSTKKQEATVEKFVSVCNKYFELSADTKTLTFDVENLQVIVKDEFTNTPIKLDDLSSGEKQIISFMSYLYLDNKPKIVLIDEPELSLSIEWQRLVIPDMIDSKNVIQLLAITHSPFIFDNSLHNKAKMLSIHRENLNG
ncbi:AAA family ATPase [Aeromonas sp. SG16]|uniref:AAA family ATPase n=1 Tax=Aeromonas sp. SG16 TaxID=2950548 RepID=UPI00210E9E87|nr:AAA family ATPase [Aeromonas sp. SG16]MCQ4053987.1 ATP-binding protein [Aeromonas sp. SG16]